MQDDIVDAIEEEMLEEQKLKEEGENPEKKVTPLKIEGADAPDDKFVTQREPDISTSYKDRLEKVYDDLSSLNIATLDEQINSIKSELKQLIEEIDANEERIRASVVEKIDNQMSEPIDLHYQVKAKPVVVSEAKDPFFTPTNIIAMGLIVFSIAIGIFIIAML